jgi:outer membrane lipoprotein-sorting protein
MTTTKKFGPILVLAFITVALLASGCTEKDQSVEEITSQMKDKENSIQDYSYTMYMTSYIEDETEEIEYKTMFKKSNMFKSIATNPGKQNQNIRILDGEFMWTYIQDTNTITKIAISNIPEPMKNDYTSITDRFLNNTKVTLLGEENIDGRTTYLLEATPEEMNGGSELIYKTKIWVDQEIWMPLKYEIYSGNGNLTMKLEIRDLKVNTGIPDSEFKFEIPKGAKILDLSGEN